MARDTEKNDYFYVGIPRDSQTYHLLLRDAQECGLSVPKLIAVRLTDWYAGARLLPADAAFPRSTPQGERVPDAEAREQSLVNASAALEEWG